MIQSFGLNVQQSVHFPGPPEPSMQAMSLTTARKEFLNLPEMVQEEPMFVTRHGRPVMTLLSVDQFEGMMETIEILERSGIRQTPAQEYRPGRLRQDGEPGRGCRPTRSVIPRGRAWTSKIPPGIRFRAPKGSIVTYALEITEEALAMLTDTNLPSNVEYSGRRFSNPRERHHGTENLWGFVETAELVSTRSITLSRSGSTWFRMSFSRIYSRHAELGSVPGCRVEATAGSCSLGQRGRWLCAIRRHQAA